MNLILWDEQGQIEPSLNFAETVPGRHNSQMMPSPSHAIRDSAAELDAHRERFELYVVGVAGRFKDDARLFFWQLYNEAVGDPHAYRDAAADANLNRLLAWTRQWVKSAGTRTPVTAAGGPEHLCTETLNRPAADLFDVLEDLAGRDNGFVAWELMVGRDNCRFAWGHLDVLEDLAGRDNGFVAWELMVGRDNCRFAWGHLDGPDEPVEPFHGVRRDGEMDVPGRLLLRRVFRAKEDVGRPVGRLRPRRCAGNRLARRLGGDRLGRLVRPLHRRRDAGVTPATSGHTPFPSTPTAARTGGPTASAC